MKPVFSTTELKRVGVAATMLVICGTIVILALTMMLGYSSLIHCGPKAVVDGAVIALLIGQRGRWRCLALLGIVYGLVLLLQVGVLYLLPVIAIATGVAALVGRCIGSFHRPTAIVAAAVVYELLAGFGAPIRIYFGTDGRNEPFLWGLWFLEWPLRIVGASIGVWLSSRALQENPVEAEALPVLPMPRPTRCRRTVPAGLAILMSLIGCTLPLFIQSAWVLGAISIAFILYALFAGVRRGLINATLAMAWGWLVFGAFSYAWNRDLDLVLDLWRTLVLRFTPLTMASIVLVANVRPAGMVRFLRRLRVPGAVLLPLAMVFRSIPHARHTMRQSIHHLREQGHWRGPISMLRRPVTIFRALLVPQITRWAGELSEEASTSGARNGPL